MVAGAMIAALAALFAFKAAAKMPDFEVYWRAGARAHAAEPLYRDTDEHFQFKYLPAFAVLCIPASLLPLTASKAVWFTVSAALIPILIALSVTLPSQRNRPPWLLATLTFVLMAKFYGHELILGQVNILFAVVVVLSVRASMDRHTAAAGLLIALAIVIKPYAVLFVPWLLARREWRALTAAAAGVAVALVLPMAIYDLYGTVALHLAWWQTVTGSTAPNLLNADNVSLAAMFAKWLGVGRAAALTATAGGVALLALVVAVVAMRRGVSAPEGLEAAMLLTLMPLLSPQGWDYVFLIATPAIVYLLDYDRALPPVMRTLTWISLVLVGFSLYDILGRTLYARFMALSLITVCYLVMIGALTTLRYRRAA
jgi:alpha-1,2-mannosyltransferase